MKTEAGASGEGEHAGRCWGYLALEWGAVSDMPSMRARHRPASWYWDMLGLATGDGCLPLHASDLVTWPRPPGWAMRGVFEVGGCGERDLLVLS